MKGAIVGARSPLRFQYQNRHPSRTGVGGTMHDSPSSEHQLHQTTLPLLPSSSERHPSHSPENGHPDRYDFAKWPPDDNDLPGGGGPGGLGGGGGPIGPYDGDFKKGRFNPKLVLLVALIIIGGGVLAIFALKNESAKLSVDQIAAIKKN